MPGTRTNKTDILAALMGVAVHWGDRQVTGQRQRCKPISSVYTGNKADGWNSKAVSFKIRSGNGAGAAE